MAAARALAAAKHPETGSRLFPKIIETAEAYQIDPTREGYPDLIALPDEPYWVRTKLTSSSAWVEPDANLPGTHRPEGVVALADVGLPPGRNLKAHLTDVTPTILALLGLVHPGSHRRKADRRLAEDRRSYRGLLAVQARHRGTTHRGPPSTPVRILIRRAGNHRAAPDRPRLPRMTAHTRSNPAAAGACATGCTPSRHR